MSEHIDESIHCEDAAAATTWVVVIADAAGPERAVQYEPLGGNQTLLQKALRRALRIAPPKRLFVTLREEDRAHWEPPLWFLRRNHRLVVDDQVCSGLAATAAFLHIATVSASDIVVVIPARCFVGDEDALHASICRAVTALPAVREGALALGVRDHADGPDEDYLLPFKVARGSHLRLLGVARQPAPWVASDLTRSGALVDSGILIGYAGVFCAHVSRFWPGISKSLMRTAEAGAISDKEVAIQNPNGRRIPAAVVRALKWHPPYLPQCAMPVDCGGWSGLRSARAIERVRAILEARSQVDPEQQSTGTSNWR